MQSPSLVTSRLNTGHFPPPDPIAQVQSPVSPIHVEPSSPAQEAPAFPVPQLPLPLTGTQLVTPDGVDAHSSVAPPFPMPQLPQRHDTSPTVPATLSPAYLHPLRSVQSDSALSSHSRPASPAGHHEPIATVSVVSDTNRKLHETLVYPEGEIPIIEDDGFWAHVQFKPLTTKTYDGGHKWKLFGSKLSWTIAYGALSDKYFFLFREETSPKGGTKTSHLIKPIPLECLRLASFDDEPEVRKVPNEQSSKWLGSRAQPSPTVISYPFTIYHSAAKITRRHTVYTHSATERNRWKTSLDGAIEARKSQEDPKLYAPQVINDGGFFRIAPRILLNREALYTGPITCAALFSLQGDGYIAVGCPSGIYVSRRTTEYSFRKVLEFDGPTSMVAIPAFNKFIVHCESTLFSYPLDIVVHVSRGDATTKDLDGSVEWLSREDGPVSFLKVGHGDNRTVVIYAARVFEVKVHVQELTRPDANLGTPAIYRRLGSPVIIPEDPYDATFYLDKIAICAPQAIYITDFNSASDSSPVTVPDFPNSKRDTKSLKFVPKGKGAPPKILELAGNANVLGMVTCENHNDILLVYDAFGCFMAKDGKPARSSYYIEWERRATAHARHGSHLLLFSSGCLEVRHIETGKLVQIKETNEIRLLRSGLIGPGILVAAMPGGTDNDGGRTERLVEILYYGVDDARVHHTLGVTGG